MESFQDKSLSLDEKAKLKERLALLKKEYKRTVNRLQRSQRAERVKSHVKKTIEEQNRLLSQEYAITSALGSPGLADYTGNTPGAVGESQEGAVHRTVDKHRKLNVSFNLEPDVLPAGGKSSPCSGGESSGQEADASNKDEGNGTRNPEQRPRSRLRLSRSLKRASVSQSPSANVIQLENVTNVQEDHTINVVAERSGSPVFKKCLQEDVPIKTDTAPKAEDLCPEAGAERDAPSSLEMKDPPDDPTDTTARSGILTAKEPMHSCLDNVYSRLEPKQGQPLHGPEVSAEHRTHCNAAAASIVHHSPLQPSDGQRLTSLDVRAELSAAEEERSPLTSCTLVEGLLFPVEYYVRTTRRMTSCQRIVDINAVINSHLGLTKRGRPRRRSASMSPLAVSDSPSTFTSPPVNNGATEVKRPKRGRGRKSCPAAMTTSSGLEEVALQLEFGSGACVTLNGFQSERVNCEAETPSMTGKHKDHYAENTGTKEALDIQDGAEPSQADRKGYRLRPRSTTSLPVQTSPIDRQDLEINPYILGASKDGTEPTGSPFPPFSGSVSLDHLLRRLDITDFHLPDEEFGVLKLQKLKSTNHLEPFTPKPTKGRRNGRRTRTGDNASPQFTDLSTTSRVTLVASASSPGPDLKLLASHKDSMDDPISRHEDNPEDSISLSVEALKHELVVSQAYDPINSLKLSPVVCGPVESHPPRELLPLDQSLEDAGLDVTRCSAEEDTCPIDVSSNITGATPFSALRLDGRHVSVQGTDVLEKFSGPCERVCSTQTERNAGPNTQTQTTPLIDCSPKQQTPSVILSTSMCSGPLESINDSVALDGTPQYPFLGPTPAVFSSPLPTNAGIASEENSERRGLLPEAPVKDRQTDMSPDIKERTVTQGVMDSYSCCGIVTPEGLSQACDKTVDHPLCDSKDDHEKKPLMETSKVNEDGELLYEPAHRLDCDNAGGGPLDSGHLRLVTEIQDTCGGGCAVDLCSVWWEFSGCTELCIMSASESCVCLWRPQTAGKWTCAHTWAFTEMPVIQILPLSQEKNMVCVALGTLEIMEIWVLFTPPERQSWERKVVKCGHTKTAHGLSRLRVASSSAVGGGQVVEVRQLSEEGSTLGSLTLSAPQDSILAFSEVDGERDALVGSTVDNNLLIWNAVTGHLLSTIYIGAFCSDVVCLRATSDAGLLYFIIGSLFGKHCDSTGSCIFRLIAANPRGGASALVMSYTVPDSLNSRYQEGDVKQQSAAAVLTCGSIALWDLPRKLCSAMLPPSSDTPWCLVRWAHNTSCLLAGRKDGAVFIYEYADPYSNKTRDERRRWPNRAVSQVPLDGRS